MFFCFFKLRPSHLILSRVRETHKLGLRVTFPFTETAPALILSEATLREKIPYLEKARSKVTRSFLPRGLIFKAAITRFLGFASIAMAFEPLCQSKLGEVM